MIEPRINREQTGMLYRTWHLRDCVWAENADLAINQFHRKWKLDARALCQLAKASGWKDLDPKVQDRATKDPFSEINCRVIVLPADEYDSYGKDENGAARQRGPHPFVRIVVDEEHQTILEEVPQPDLGHVIPRWVTIGGFSQYAYSPTAIVALPDARMLQQMTLTLIEIGQKIVDPPMIAVGDAIQGGTNLYAGAINWVDPDYDERTGEVLRPITLNGSGLQWGSEYEDKIEKVLQEAFFLNVLNLPPIESGDKMTATEVQARMREYIQRATPLFEPMDIEYNGQLCHATWQMIDRIGGFGSIWDRPRSVARPPGGVQVRQSAGPGRRRTQADVLHKGLPALRRRDAVRSHGARRLGHRHVRPRCLRGHRRPGQMAVPKGQGRRDQGAGPPAAGGRTAGRGYRPRCGAGRQGGRRGEEYGRGGYGVAGRGANLALPYASLISVSGPSRTVISGALAFANQMRVPFPSATGSICEASARFTRTGDLSFYRWPWPSRMAFDISLIGTAKRLTKDYL